MIYHESKNRRNSPNRGGNKNLIDNWYFKDPINQRGITGDTTAYAGQKYTLDRWVQWEGGFTGAILPGEGYRLGPDEILSGSSQNYSIIQRFENGFIPFEGLDLTASVLFSNGQLFSATAKNIKHVADGAQFFRVDDPTKSFRIGLRNEAAQQDPKNARIEFIRVSTATFVPVVMAVKLEIGDCQTLAKQKSDGTWGLLDPPPDKGEELLKCMRYQQVIDNSMLFAGIKTQNNMVRMVVPLTVPLRAKPTIINNSDNGLGMRGVNGTLSMGGIKSMSLSDVSNVAVALNITTASENSETPNETPLQGYLNKTIIFDANL